MKQELKSYNFKKDKFKNYISLPKKMEYLKINENNMKEWFSYLVTIFQLTLNVEKGNCIINNEMIEADSYIYDKDFVNRNVLEEKLTELFSKDKVLSLVFNSNSKKINMNVSVKLGDYFTKLVSNNEEFTINFYKKNVFFNKFNIESMNECSLKEFMIKAIRIDEDNILNFKNKFGVDKFVIPLNVSDYIAKINLVMAEDYNLEIKSVFKNLVLIDKKEFENNFKLII